MMAYGSFEVVCRQNNKFGDKLLCQRQPFLAEISNINSGSPGKAGHTNVHQTDGPGTNHQNMIPGIDPDLLISVIYAG